MLSGLDIAGAKTFSTNRPQVIRKRPLAEPVTRCYIAPFIFCPIAGERSRMPKVQGKLKGGAGTKTAVKKASRPKARVTAPKRTNRKPARPIVRSSKQKPSAKALAVKKKVVAKISPLKARTPSPKPTIKMATPAPKATPKAAVPKAPDRLAIAVPRAAAAVIKPPLPPVAKLPASPQPRRGGNGAAEAASADKRKRRVRPRIASDGVPVANWLSRGEKPRPSSFMPAPARAQVPSLVAAPPASSDRLVRLDELAPLDVRTVPIRVDIEQASGRVYLGINPDEVVLHAGEGVEWDFRYVGGADVYIEELIIEFGRPSPFADSTFKSRRPGIGRPHRQLSGPALKGAMGKRFRCTIRARNAFHTELASATPWVSVV